MEIPNDGGLGEFLDTLDATTRQQVVDITTRLWPDVASFLEEDPKLLNKVGYSGTDDENLTGEQQLRYYKEKIDEQEKKFVFKMDNTPELKRAIGNKFDEFKEILKKDLRTRYTGFTLNGNCLGTALHYITDKCETLPKGTTLDQVKTKVTEAYQEMQQIFGTDYCKLEGLDNVAQELHKQINE